MPTDCTWYRTGDSTSGFLGLCSWQKKKGKRDKVVRAAVRQHVDGPTARRRLLLVLSPALHPRRFTLSWRAPLSPSLLDNRVRALPSHSLARASALFSLSFGRQVPPTRKCVRSASSSSTSSASASSFGAQLMRA